MILDGNLVASKLEEEVANEIKSLGFHPKLAVVLVGEDLASRIYVERKRKICAKIGIRSELHEFPLESSQEEIEDFIDSLAKCPHRKMDGILVQLPLPPHLNKNRILNTVPPEMDVDGFNLSNMGRLTQGEAVLKPCTPAGILEILKHYNIQTHGKKVVIVNRSQVVGQPLSLMLAQEPYNSTVIVIHEHTVNPSKYISTADIIVTAVGKYPDFHLNSQDIKIGSVVIDVAINRKDNRIFGDVVDFEEAKKRASFITPVPGGVGPVTVAMLMKNTLTAAKLKRGIL